MRLVDPRLQGQEGRIAIRGEEVLARGLDIERRQRAIAAVEVEAADIPDRFLVDDQVTRRRQLGVDEGTLDRLTRIQFDHRLAHGRIGVHRGIGGRIVADQVGEAPQQRRCDLGHVIAARI